MLCARFSAELDYGVSGIGLMVVFYLFLEHLALCFAASTAYMLVWSADGHGYPLFGMEFGMRIFATPAVMLASLPIRRKTRTPKWLSYGFYRRHLLALLALEKFFEKEVDRRRRIRYTITRSKAAADAEQLQLHIGELCNGSTYDSDSYCLGSNP